MDIFERFCLIAPEKSQTDHAEHTKNKVWLPTIRHCEKFPAEGH